jgi:hypothetical protein
VEIDPFASVLGLSMDGSDLTGLVSIAGVGFRVERTTGSGGTIIPGALRASAVRITVADQSSTETTLRAWIQSHLHGVGTPSGFVLRADDAQLTELFTWTMMGSRPASGVDPFAANGTVGTTFQPGSVAFALP